MGKSGILPPTKAMLSLLVAFASAKTEPLTFRLWKRFQILQRDPRVDMTGSVPSPPLTHLSSNSLSLFRDRKSTDEDTLEPCPRVGQNQMLEMDFLERQKLAVFLQLTSGRKSCERFQ